MRLNVKLLVPILIASAGLAAADMFDYRWKAPDAQPANFSGKKVVVLIHGKNRLAVLAAEQALAADITAHGAQGIAAHEIASDTDLSSKDKAQALFQKEGVAGVILIAGETKGKAALDPDVWRTSRFWETYGAKSASSGEGGSKEDIALYMQTKVFSLDQDKLLWVGTSETKVSKIDDFIKELVGSVVEEMQKQGLMNPK